MRSQADNTSEEELIAKAKQGDLQAFGALVERYQDQIYTLVCKTLGSESYAADVAQETFIRAWRAIAQFQGRSKFSSWLYRISLNSCYSELRRRGQAADNFGPERLEALSIPAASDGGFEKKIEQRDLIAKLLEQLPPLYRTIVVLHYLEQLHCEEIALIINRPLGTVKAYLHRARAFLRQHAEIIASGEPPE